MRKPIFILIGLAALPFRVLWADEGRIPIFQPTTITQPGYYIVTRDISLATGAVVRIQSDDVTLDLNGHLLASGCGPGVQAVIHADTPSTMKAVIIRNGRIRAGCDGIYANGAGRLLIEQMDIEPFGALNGGIFIANFSQMDVIDNYVHDSPVDGINIQSVSNSFSGRILRNTVRSVGRRGLLLAGLLGGEVRGNIVEGFGSAFGGQSGIQLGGAVLGTPGGVNVIEDNRVSSLAAGITARGMFIDSSSPGNLVARNIFSGNSAAGIWLFTDETRFENNVTNRNGNNGIRVFGTHNHLEGNQALGNTGCGISLEASSQSNNYRNNVVRTNTGGGVCDSGTANTDAGGNIL